MDGMRIEFGDVLAWLVPGFVAFIGLGYVSVYVDSMISWLFVDDVALGAAVVAVLMSLALGLVIAAVRETLLDGLHRWTGIDGSAVSGAAARLYGNLLIGIAVALLARVYGTPVKSSDVILVIAGIIACLVLAVAHRRALARSGP